MKNERSYLTKNLPFEGNEEQLKPGEKGYLKPGWNFNESGDIVDEEGNIRDPETGGIIAEKPSPGLKKARRLYPSVSKDEQVEWAKIFDSQTKAEEKQNG